MPWYRAGSVAVTNGSAIVTGAGTDFVGNVSVGEGFVAPDRAIYEVAQVISAAQLQLATPYQGASAGGQGYSLLPTQSQMRDLALAAAQLLNTFGAVRDGIGQGLIPDGNLASPGIRFSNDQDTGIFRLNTNVLGIVGGGALLGYFGAGGLLSMNAVSAQSPEFPTLNLVRTNVGSWVLGGSGTANDNDFTLRLNSEVPFVRVDTGGNLMVGVQTADHHRLVKPSTINQGQRICSFGFLPNNAESVLEIYASASGNTGSAANAVLKVNADGVSGRSIGSKGTINASGADYAEYVLKAAGCGVIAKGDVCGIDHDGKLTKTWADAISFVVKSTDPSLVGGDTWAVHLAARPEQPAPEPLAPALPTEPAVDADEATIVAWQAAQTAYPALLAAHQAEHAAWQRATDTYTADLAAWEQDLEAARQCVDRIAFCGQVPCNVTGDFEVGDYIIAAAAGAGIKAIAVKPDAMTLPQYMRRIGKVWAIRNGRAWIDVQHG